MRQEITTLTVNTAGPGFTEITHQVAEWVADIGAGRGLVTAFVRHTSASLTIQENADPDVLRDLADALGRLAPENAGYRHSIEGPDDMPAHIRSMLTSVSVQIPVVGSKLALGTWQGLFLIEHRARAHRREIVLVFQGE